MEKYIVKGGTPLKGEVYISGAKNSAVALLPATVLANDVCVLENVPDISDIRKEIEILKEMKKSGMMPIISSDCHNSEHLDFGYDIAYKLIKDAGYTSALIFEDGKFVEYPV